MELLPRSVQIEHHWIMSVCFKPGLNLGFFLFVSLFYHLGFRGTLLSFISGFVLNPKQTSQKIDFDFWESLRCKEQSSAPAEHRGILTERRQLHYDLLDFQSELSAH